MAHDLASRERRLGIAGILAGSNTARMQAMWLAPHLMERLRCLPTAPNVTHASR